MTKKVLSVFFIVLTLSFSGLASGPFFVSCKEAFKSKQFKPLKDAFKEAQPEQCFRMNDREFLATLTDAARMDQGLFYYDTRKKVLEPTCGRNCFQPGVRIEREFLGAGNKNYVLLKSSDLHSGVGSDLYEVLNLVPAEQGKSPYVQYTLISAESTTWGDRSERCVKDDESQEILPEEDADIKSYSIENEGTAKVRLVFEVEGQNCKTNAKISKKVVFALKDGVFKAL